MAKDLTARLRALEERIAVLEKRMAVAPGRPKDEGLHQRAREVISEMLEDYPVCSQHAMTIGTWHGIGRSTWLKAKASVGVKSRKSGGHWYWYRGSWPGRDPDSAWAMSKRVFDRMTSNAN